MSLFSANSGQHLTITAPGATALASGPYSVFTLYRNIANLGNDMWYAYMSSGFSKLSAYFDGDLYIDFAQWDGSLDISTPTWWWIGTTKDSASEPPRAHVAAYAPTGGLTWNHADTSSARPTWPAIDRFSFGDEFGSGFRGDIAVHTAFETEMSDATVEATFIRSSATIMNANPQFFTHWPEVDGIGSPFADIAGGGVETIRSGTWSASDDPDNFDFSLGRSGQPKTWSGSTWDKHSAKAWNGSSWTTHPMLGYDGTEFVPSK